MGDAEAAGDVPGVREAAVTTRLESFRDHCARMATAEHKPECPMLTWVEPYWCSWVPVYDENDEIPRRLVWAGPKPTTGEFQRPTCDGCNPEADRDLFRRLSAEVDQYLDGQLWEDA